MNGESELLGAVAKVARAFDALGIEYLVGGSIASRVFGEPRQTIDADLLARVLGRHADPLVQTLTPEFYSASRIVGYPQPEFVQRDPFRDHGKGRRICELANSLCAIAI